MEDAQCKWWEYNNMLCLHFFKNHIKENEGGVQLNKEDFSLEHCNKTGGKSNCVKCAWFTQGGITSYDRNR
jgi:hypothetical protein